MTEIFSNIYEFGGLLPFYSSDLGDHLRGFDSNCTNFIGSPYYTYVGTVMVGSCLLAAALQYYIIDSPRYNSKYTWWLTTAILFAVNLIFAYTVASNSLQPGKFCTELSITSGDVFGFGISNALCGFIFYLLITTIPIIRSKSTNCKYTTFYQP